MRDARQRVSTLLVFGFVLVICPSAGRAAPCGDVDDTGAVTVTDGVQVLRGAAGLSGPCTLEPLRCDVDDDGAVSVTDGVVVLRVAAGLPASAGCNGADVATAVVALTPLLTGILPGFIVTAPSTTHPCPLGGTITAVISGAMVTTDFEACHESLAGRELELEGTVVHTFDGATFAMTVRDPSTDATTDFSGTVPRVMGLPDGGLELDGGGLTMTIAGGAPALTFDRLTIAGTGRLQSGSVRIDDGNDELRFVSIAVAVAGPTNADVHEVPDDGNGADFALDLASGRVTPARR